MVTAFHTLQPSRQRRSAADLLISTRRRQPPPGRESPPEPLPGGGGERAASGAGPLRASLHVAVRCPSCFLRLLHCRPAAAPQLRVPRCPPRRAGGDGEREGRGGGRASRPCCLSARVYSLIPLPFIHPPALPAGAARAPRPPLNPWRHPLPCPRPAAQRPLPPAPCPAPPRRGASRQRRCRPRPARGSRASPGAVGPGRARRSHSHLPRSPAAGPARPRLPPALSP